jgi:hypothetical protein
MTADVKKADPTPTAKERATAIFDQWRNKHLNNLPPAAFDQLQQAGPHLIAEIEKLV